MKPPSKARMTPASYAAHAAEVRIPSGDPLQSNGPPPIPPRRLRLLLPFPPSPNHWLIPVVVKGAARLIPSTESKAYKAAVQKTHAHVRPLEGPLHITRLACFPAQNNRDLDNTFKVLLDSLKGVAWGDDKQIKRIDGVEMFRADGVPRVEMTVEEMGAVQLELLELER